MVLVKVDQDNIKYYKKFEEEYKEKISEFQSRIYPREELDVVKWYYIKEQDEIIGSIWLEKKSHESFATLGIFIIDEKFRGQGIGKQAIQSIISADAKQMNIDEIRLNVRESNVRAIRCYKRLGFEEFKRYKTDNGISAISMRFKI